jgi:PAS domain-containing protein
VAENPKDAPAEASAVMRLGAALKAEESSRQDLATALAHERTLLRTMIDLIPAFIYAKDVGSRFIAMNAALARNMGTTADDAIGKTDFDFHKPELAKKFYSD